MFYNPDIGNFALLYLQMTYQSAVLDSRHAMLTITCKSWTQENINLLQEGDIQFAFGTLPQQFANVHSTSAAAVSSSVLFRKNHPLAFQPVELINNIKNFI